MKALIWKSKEEKSLELVDKPYPKIINSRDAIIRVTYSSICTSDLHIRDGFVPLAKEGIVLGHDFVGEVVELGGEVTNLKIGDRVSANCETFCGECFFCKRGFINNCEQGGWELGCKIDGGQAEFVRIPFADTNLKLIPDSLTYQNALFVGDILSSGYFGAELCEIKPNDTVAIIGAGPVGICAMQSTRVFGAKKIIAIDVKKDRLNLVKEKGYADYIFNPLESDIEAEIKNINENRGADCVIECAGGEDTFEMAWKIARANAIVAIVGMYEKNQILPLPEMYGKNLIFKTGGVDAIHCEKLLKLIEQGKIDTDVLITQVFDFENILKAYEFFENKPEFCLKLAIKH